MCVKASQLSRTVVRESSAYAKKMSSCERMLNINTGSEVIGYCPMFRERPC